MRHGVSTHRRSRCAGQSHDACRGVGASARTGASDRQRTAGVGGDARATARCVRSLPVQPRDRRGDRQSQRTRQRDSPTSSSVWVRASNQVLDGPRASPAPMPRSRKAPRMSRRSRGRCSGWRRRAYYRAVHANERIRLLNATLGAGSWRVRGRRSSLQGRRHRRPRCEHRSRVLGTRSRGARGAEASKALALGELRQLLRSREDVDVEGSLVACQESRPERRASGAATATRATSTRGRAFRKRKPSCGSVSASRSPNTASASDTRAKKVTRSSSAA